MLGEMLEAVQVEAEREAAAARVLADAFYDDPFVSWMYPAAARRRERFRRVCAKLLAVTRGRNHALRTTDDGACALWLAPGEPALTRGEQLRMLSIIPGLGWRAPRTLAVLDLMDRKHPHEPHWYLFLVGSDPARRGQGHGRAVIQPVLDECDRDGSPAYLESSNPENVPYYARFGFEATGEISRAGSPPLIPMWREPASGPSS
jgi:GNAT superfamily N-acetyltransferase